MFHDISHDICHSISRTASVQAERSGAENRVFWCILCVFVCFVCLGLFVIFFIYVCCVCSCVGLNFVSWRGPCRPSCCFVHVFSSVVHACRKYKYVPRAFFQVLYLRALLLCALLLLSLQPQRRSVYYVLPLPFPSPPPRPPHSTLSWTAAASTTWTLAL